MRSRLLGVAMSFLVLGGQALNGIPAAAASAPGAPTVVQELKHDRSGPLRSALPDQAPNDLGNRHYQPIRPRGLTPKGPLPPGPVQTAAGPSAMPPTGANFEGISNLDNVLPPDTNGDIGPNHYVQWVNLRYEIFSRTGTSILGPSPGNTLWSGFGGVCQTTNQGDPIVRYDRMADRWVFTQFAFNVDIFGNPVAPYVECLAVSTTGDPTGSYYRYAYQISSTLFNDYPKLSVWPDGYYMTFNYFDPTQPAATQFQGAGVWAFDRSKMLNGLAANAVNFQTTSTYGGLLASDLDGSILPPTGSPNYVAAIDNPVSSTARLAGSTLFIWKFHLDWTTPANSTFGTAAHTPDFNLAVASYKWDPCGASQNCIAQPGTTVGLDPIADRLMNRLQYRRFADGHESLVANHSVGVGTSGNQVAIRWYEVRNLSTTPTIYQQGTYQPDSNNRWMGSIAMDQAGDIGLGYSVSSSTVSPSIRYSGRLASDPLGTLPQGEGTIVAGSGSQTSTYYRWGDYSRMAIDPTDDCTFWYTQEYYAATSDRGWRTRIGSFKFAGCVDKAVLSGTVKNAGGTAVANTWIYAYQGGAGATCCTYVAGGLTDASGNYSFSLPAGTYKLYVNPPAPYAAFWYGGADFGPATSVAVTGNQTLNFNLNPVLSGTVKNAGGTAVANTWIYAYQGGAGATCCTYVAGGLTDASGNYSFSLPAGTYKLYVNPPAPYAAFWYGGADFGPATSVAVTGNQTLNFNLNPVLSGTVKNAGGTAVANTWIYAYQGGAGATCCTYVAGGLTDASGNYSFSLPAGTYKLYVNPPAPYAAFWYGGADFGPATSVAVTGNQTLNFNLNPVLSGTVKNAGGTAVANTWIYAYQGGAGATCCTYVAGGLTDASGNYSFSLPAGTYKLYVNAPAPYAAFWYGGADFGPATSVAVTGNQTLNFNLNPVLSGTVKNAGGTAVANTWIYAYQGGAGATCCTYVAGGLTDASGNYSFSLPAGTYKLYVNPPAPYAAFWYGGADFGPATSVAVTGNQTLNLTLKS